MKTLMMRSKLPLSSWFPPWFRIWCRFWSITGLHLTAARASPLPGNNNPVFFPLGVSGAVLVLLAHRANRIDAAPLLLVSLVAQEFWVDPDWWFSKWTLSWFFMGVQTGGAHIVLAFYQLCVEGCDLISGCLIEETVRWTPSDKDRSCGHQNLTGRHWHSWRSLLKIIPNEGFGVKSGELCQTQLCATSPSTLLGCWAKLERPASVQEGLAGW